MLQKTFEHLSWLDLEAWAGSRTLTKGRSYKTRVDQLCLTSKGGLLAWVKGSERYATYVEYEQSLTSKCSCPIGQRCKHTVAVIVHYLDLVKKGKSLPLAKDDDERFAKLERSYAENCPNAQPSDPYFAYDDEDEDDLPQYYAVKANHQAESLEEFLARQNKTSLEQLLLKFAQNYPDVRNALEDQLQASQGVNKGLLRQLHSDIENLDKIDWNDSYYGRGYAAPSVDLERLAFRLQLLLDEEHYDELVTLGHELLKQGQKLIEESHDEGELSEQIQAYMDIVLSALPYSSRSQAEQLIWLVEAYLLSDYDLISIDREFTGFWETEPNQEAWLGLVKHLQSKLDKTKSGAFSANYRRTHIANWLRLALENAGQEDKVLELLEQEALKSQAYVRFVSELIARNKLAEADSWIIRGIEATQQEAPGIASQLRDQWRSLRENEQDFLQLAALSAESFFTSPSLHAFNHLKDAAEHAQLWQIIEPLARTYLKEGKRPSQKDLGLPDLALPTQLSRSRESAPFMNVLLDLALYEKKPNEVLYWYDLGRNSRGTRGWYGYGSHHADRIAQAVQASHPERAIAIWQSIAEKLIAETKVSSYQSASEYLCKLKPVMAESWRDYILQLRDANKRKPRCVEILNGLLGHSILES